MEKDERIYHPDKKSFRGKIVQIYGKAMYEIPEYYVRTYKNETGGWTTEFSLNPFEDEKGARV